MLPFGPHYTTARGTVQKDPRFLKQRPLLKTGAWHFDQFLVRRRI
jgi:hypothetical protein